MRALYSRHMLKYLELGVWCCFPALMDAMVRFRMENTRNSSLLLVFGRTYRPVRFDLSGSFAYLQGHRAGQNARLLGPTKQSKHRIVTPQMLYHVTRRFIDLIVKHGVDFGFQRCSIEWLHDVVIYTGLFGCNHIFCFGFCRYHDEWGF